MWPTSPSHPRRLARVASPCGYWYTSGDQWCLISEANMQARLLAAESKGQKSLTTWFKVVTLGLKHHVLIENRLVAAKRGREEGEG